MSKKKLYVRSAWLGLSIVILLPFQNCGVPKIPNSFDNIASYNPDQSYPPMAATNLTLHVASDQQINLQWKDNSSNEAGFRIERASASAGPFVSGIGTFTPIKTADANTTSYIDGGLNPSTTYYYRVVAVNAAGSAAPTNEQSATTASTPTTPPSPPSNLVATATAATIINLTWTDNSNNESGFKVERSANNGGSFTLLAIAAADQTTYQDYNLDPLTTYTYRVRATNSIGDSTNSANASATTIAAINPSNFAYINVNIIQTNCVSCHGAAGAAAGVNLSSYNSVSGIVTPNSSANSQLYQVISNNSMPPGAPLSASQKNFIKTWIDNGALNN
ncbi:MAG: fibronectin type III domain-containing protein [Bdellovibrionales bacterium]